MAMYFQLRKGSSVRTISGEAGSSIVGIRYTPRTADDDQDTVTEGLTLIFEGTAGSMRSARDQIERWFNDAREYNETQRGDPVYIEGRLYNSDDLFRSEIISGRVEWAEDVVLESESASLLVTWTRRNYWEGPETEIPLANRSGSYVTGGVPVDNTQDQVEPPPYRRNSVAISNSAILGTLPSPVKIRMDPSANINAVAIYQNSTQSAADVTEQIEDNTGGTLVNDSTASAGAYRRYTLPTDNMLILTAYMNFYPRKPAPSQYVCWMRFAGSPPAGTRMQWRVISPTTGETIAETPLVLLDTKRHQNLGVIQIPPYVWNTTSLELLQFQLWGYNPSAGTINLDVAYLIAPQSWVELSRPDAVVVGSGKRLVENWIDEQSYACNTDDSAQYRFFNERKGPGIQVWPNVAQRVWFLTRNGDNAVITNGLTVAMWYRPRRRCL